MTGHDTIVIGLGAMGSAACAHLAGRGRRVLGIDQFAPGHGRGSSHGSSRMIRMCYFEHPDYVPLLHRAYSLWDELAARAAPADGVVFKRTGGIYMGPAGCRAVEGSRLAAEKHGLAHEVLTRAEIGRRFSQFAVGPDFVGLWEPDAGYLVPEAAVALHLRRAAAAGAEFATGSAVRSWSADDRGVEVRLESGAVYRARDAVIAAGAWAGEVCRAAGCLVRPTRQVLGWVRPNRPELFVEGAMPVWAIDAQREGEGLYYGFPMLEGPHQREGFKIARHAPGQSCDPADTARLGAQAGDEETFRACLSRWIPDADGPTASIATCMYENSPDGHFILDRHPQHQNVLLAAGFSGHGFKFASVVGEILAELAIDGATRHPIEFLSLSRFTSAGRAAAGA